MNTCWDELPCTWCLHCEQDNVFEYVLRCCKEPPQKKQSRSFLLVLNFHLQNFTYFSHGAVSFCTIMNLIKTNAYHLIKINAFWMVGHGGWALWKLVLKDNICSVLLNEKFTFLLAAAEDYIWKKMKSLWELFTEFFSKLKNWYILRINN